MIDLLSTGSGGVTVMATGAIIDDNGATKNIIGDTAFLTAGTSIGDGDALETQVGKIEADAANGGITIDNMGDVEIGGVSATLFGLTATGSIAFSTMELQSPAELGSITVTETVVASDAASTVDLVATAGDVTVALAALVQAVDGLLQITAGRDVSVSGDVLTLTGAGAIAVSAGRAISVSGEARSNSGTILLDAKTNAVETVVGDITISGSVTSTSGTITVLADGSIEVTGAGTVSTDPGIVFHAGDSITIAGTVMAGSGAILLDAFTHEATGVETVGKIDVSGAVSSTNGTIDLVSDGSVMITGTGSVATEENITVDAGNAIDVAGTVESLTGSIDLDAMTSEAASTGAVGDVSISGRVESTSGGTIDVLADGSVNVTSAGLVTTTSDILIDALVDIGIVGEVIGGSGSVDLVALGTITVAAGTGLVRSSTGAVRLEAGNDIIVNGLVATNAATIDVLADDSITLGATASITVQDAAADFDIVLSAGLDLGAAELGEIFMADGSVIDASAGDVDIDAVGDVTVSLVQTTGDIYITTTLGSVLDADGIGDNDLVSKNLTISAVSGAIGATDDDIEMDTTTGGDVLWAITAGTGVFLTEVAGGLKPGTISSTSGTIRVSVRDSAASGEDLLLTSVASLSADNVILRAGDDFTMDPGAEVRADVSTGSIQVFADFAVQRDDPQLRDADPDAGVGASVVIDQGILEAASINIEGGADADDFDLLSPVLLGAVTLLGQADNDTVSVIDLPSQRTDESFLIDGGEGSDDVDLDITGLTTDYLVEVFDSGTTGTDTLLIVGTTGDDDFLLRAAAAETQAGSGAKGVAFVAALHYDGAATEADKRVERVDYDKAIEFLTLQTDFDLINDAGADAVTVDDVWAVTEINTGAGPDRIQFAQIYKTKRDAGANVADKDVFDTASTTRGELSNGASFVTTVNAGGDADTITVFRNLAELNLNGEGGDDTFTIRSFAKEGSKVASVDSGAGSDIVEYVSNATVDVNGGDGVDTLRVVGTEFSDRYLVTDAAVFGTGRAVTYAGIETLEIDAAEGDDVITIQSTAADVETRVFGGLGSDDISLGGDYVSIESANNQVIEGEGLHTVNEIKGLLIVDGFGGDGSIEGIDTPVLLPFETNILPSVGEIDAYTPDPLLERVASLTISSPDTLRVDDDDDISTPPTIAGLVGRTIEVSDGQGLGRFWKILTASDNGGAGGTWVTPLTVEEPTLGDPDWADPAVGDLIAITSLADTLFVSEEPQIDRITVFEDGDADANIGSLTTENVGDVDGDTVDDIWTKLTGLGTGQGVFYNAFEAMEILLGTGNDQFTVETTADGMIAAVHGGAGADQITVNGRGGVDGRGLDAPLFIFGDTTRAGERYVDTGAPGDLQPAFGRVFSQTAAMAGDTIDASASLRNVVIFGGIGDDSIIGSQAGDLIAGGSGSDQISAAAGNDIVYGDGGIDFGDAIAVLPDLEERIVVFVDQVSAVQPAGDDLTAPGNDRINGDAGDDIIIADYGVVDQDPAEISATDRALDTSRQSTRRYLRRRAKRIRIEDSQQKGSSICSFSSSPL